MKLTWTTSHLRVGEIRKGKRKEGSLGQTYLDAGFRKIGLHGDLFPGVDVWIVRLLKRPLELFQLR